MHTPSTSLQAVTENLMACEWSRELFRAAELGDAEAQRQLGGLYVGEAWYDEVAAEAVKWLVRAAQQGHADAQFELAFHSCPEFSRDLPELQDDPDATFKWMLAAAKQGHAEAIDYMGDIYAQGLAGVPQDFNEGAKWYFLGAKGSLDSSSSLHCIYGLIDLIKRSVCKLSSEDESLIAAFIRAKVDIVRQGVAQGINFAQHDLDVLLAQGLGLTEEDEEAVKSIGLTAVLIRKDVDMIRQDAQDGKRSAQRRLGNLYAHGIWVAADDEEAIKWHSLAAAEEDECPHNSYGKFEFDSKDIAVFRRNADRCGSRLQRHLGELFEKGEYPLKNGEHLECDMVEAARWYALSAEQGDSVAQFAIAFMYDQGQGVSTNDELAAKWYKKAAEQGHTLAQYFLGMMYEIGCGLDQSDRLARRWYLAAAKQGDENALYSLGLLYQYGQGVREDKTLAQRWFSASAKRGYVWAKIALALVTEDRSDLLRATESLFFEHKSVALGRIAYCGSQLEDWRECLDNLITRNPLPKGTPAWTDNWNYGDNNSRIWVKKLSAIVRVAMTLRGMLFLVGDDRNETEARICFNQAASNGDQVAPYYLATLELTNDAFDLAQQHVENRVKPGQESSESYCPDGVITHVLGRVEPEYGETFLNSLELLFQELAQNIRDSKAKKQAADDLRRAELKAAEDSHKRTLSFLTHTLNNTLSTGPETVRTVIEILGSDLYDQGQEQCKAINNMASLYPVFLFVESLLKEFKLYVSDPEQLRAKWDNDRSGDATVSLVMAMALRQSIARFVFSSNHLGQLKRLLPGQDKEAIKQVRKSFVEEMIPLEISVETAGKVFDWVKAHFGMLQVEIATDAEMRFSSNATRHMFFFAAFSELVYNALKYSDGAQPIQLRWYRDGSDYCFTCVNSCPVGAGTTSTQEGTNTGLFFIDKLMSMLRESGLSCVQENGEYRASLRFDHNNFGERDT